jgi:hypothetical protein
MYDKRDARTEARGGRGGSGTYVASRGIGEDGEEKGEETEGEAPFPPGDARCGTGDDKEEDGGAGLLPAEAAPACRAGREWEGDVLPRRPEPTGTGLPANWVVPATTLRLAPRPPDCDWGVEYEFGLDGGAKPLFWEGDEGEDEAC